MSLETFSPDESRAGAARVLRAALSAAIRQLTSRPGYGLLDANNARLIDAIQGRLCSDEQCSRLAGLAHPTPEDQDLLLAAVTKIAQNEYCAFLYQWAGTAGDPVQFEAFQELGRYFHKLAYNYFRRKHFEAETAQQCARDCAQAGLADVARGLAQVRDPGAFLGWARVVLAHVCAHYLRDLVRRREVLAADLVRTDPNGDNDDADQSILDLLGQILEEDPAWASDLAIACEEGIRQLGSNLERQVIRLTYWGDLSAAEIAHVLGISEAYVNTLRSRGRDRLRDSGLLEPFARRGKH